MGFSYLLVTYNNNRTSIWAHNYTINIKLHNWVILCLIQFSSRWILPWTLKMNWNYWNHHMKLRYLGWLQKLKESTNILLINHSMMIKNISIHNIDSWIMIKQAIIIHNLANGWISTKNKLSHIKIRKNN